MVKVIDIYWPIHLQHVIDVCGRHGIWLDADELPRILDWIHAGGLARANEELAAKENSNDNLRKSAKLDVVMMERLNNLDQQSINRSLMGNALGALLNGLFRLR